MDIGAESSSPSSPSPEAWVVGGGVVIDFPVSDKVSFSSPRRIPKNLQKRLLEAKTPTSSSVEEIEAKLRHAHLRRQQFYEKLSSKARPKPRSPSQCSSHEEDLAQRLEAKLHAAEQKRLSILEKAQMRLARLDELRQAAKTGVEMRFERERERLGTKVELRVQQAEANRMLMLKAYRQRRATLKERTSQSLSRRMARESKYKERVRAAINQKRAAAEKKRMGLLEAEKRRACARVLQVQRVARSVSHQREIERRRMRDKLEDRLQRAKRQRAEYLRQRGRQHSSVRVNWNKMHKQADLLSRKLARCWRQFLRSRRTTIDLAKDYDALKINENCVKSMPFEQLARLIESTGTLQTVKALLDRVESRFRVSMAVATMDHPSSLENIDHLLKRVATPRKRRTTPRSSMRSREAKRVGTTRESAKSAATLSRYRVRIVLCAYMILGHPDAVFSGQGQREIALAKSAEDFIREFELLIRIILDGPMHSSDEDSESMSPKRCTFRSQLAAFDKEWCSYLNCFAVWKVKDAQSLEEDLVRAACQLELSMIQKCKLTPEGSTDALTHDMKAIQKQVTEDQKLLREKVQHLSGDAGIERMEIALSETRSRYFQAKENGSPVGSPIIHFLSPSMPPYSPSATGSANRNNVSDGIERPSRVVRSLFREDTSSAKEPASSATSSSHFDGQSGSAAGKSITENELIINEFLHEQRHGFMDRFNLADKDENSLKEKVRETMEAAFWDSVLESMKQDEPKYEWVVQLVGEVRDEIKELAPESWKQEIVESIDPDLLAQVLRSGNLDVSYCGKILEFALVTLQKLSSPAHEDEMKALHQKMLKELAQTCQTEDESKYSHIATMIKGLRFVLQQIQALKQEISKARIRMMEPLLTGPAALDYLRKAFANHYGSDSDACNSLPLAMQWLSSVKSSEDQEWEEHKNSLLALKSHDSSSRVFVPLTTLRTGGSFLVKTNESVIASSSVASETDNQQPEPECTGERVDLLVRLGLLKLVSGVSGLTKEALPETFMLNLLRLRAVQAQIQKIIVISTSILVCRQMLLMEQAVTSSADMESILLECSNKLSEVLDRVDDAGIEEIVEVVSGLLQVDDTVVDEEKLKPRKIVMARMLAKSLQAGDPIFEKVSHAVYLALRGIVLGGSGPRGRKLVEMALRQIGAVMLTKRVVAAAEVLVVAATVSTGIHRPWYVNLTDNL
uniref:T-complex protein 11 n=1 Tax=Populus davidiana TaxID=266767 RepID=A0A6M2EXE5_9ROSI